MPTTDPTSTPDAAAAAPAPELLTRSLAIRALRDEKREADFVASTDALDSYGEVVEQSWELTRFKANPVALYNHSRFGDSLPIGYASNVGVEDGQLVCTLKFVTADANPLAERVWQSIKQKSLRAVSVGFMPRDVRREVRGGKEVYVLSDNELHEISVTPLPANPEALARMRARAKGLAAAPPATTDPAPAPPSGAAAASSPPNDQETRMKFLPLAAKMNVAAPNEEAAEAAIVALAEEAAQLRAGLGTKSTAESVAKLAELSTAAAELPKAAAERDALRAEKSARVELERKSHVDAWIAGDPAAREPARAALEAFAKADYDAFCKSYPLPKVSGNATKLAAENAQLKAIGLTTPVAPAAGAPAPHASTPVIPGDHATEAKALAAELKQKNPQLSDREALKQASAQLKNSGPRAAVRS